MSNEWDDMIVDSQPEESTALQKQVYEEFRPTLDQMVAAWLHEKSGLSGSKWTKYRYDQLMTQFRDVLKSAGIDLDGDYKLIAMLAQGWADTTTYVKNVSAATFNARIIALRSFYEYALKHDYVERNPMKLVEPRKMHVTNAANPIDQEDVVKIMQSIDRSTPRGLRDYAFLSVALTTGRRSAELSGMRIGHLHYSGVKITVTFPRCKGGKVMKDTLQPGVTKALVTYLASIYPNQKITNLPADSGIWLSFSARNKGQTLSEDGGRVICERWLGTGKIHTTRHTFAVNMEEAGAKLSDIGARLGHSNLNTTSRYMERFHSSENKFGADLEKMFGIE